MDSLFINSTAKEPREVSTDVMAGKQYGGGFLKRWILGEHYRDSWTEKVHNIPILDLDTTAGGLRPYAKGGGAHLLTVGAYNSYNRRNPYFLFIEEDLRHDINDTEIVLKQASLFPVLPSFSYAFQF